jgi:hypothetical protein
MLAPPLASGACRGLLGEILGGHGSSTEGLEVPDGMELTRGSSRARDGRNMLSCDLSGAATTPSARFCAVSALLESEGFARAGVLLPD